MSLLSGRSLLRRHRGRGECETVAYRDPNANDEINATDRPDGVFRLRLLMRWLSRGPGDLVRGVRRRVGSCGHVSTRSAAMVVEAAMGTGLGREATLAGDLAFVAVTIG